VKFPEIHQIPAQDITAEVWCFVIFGGMDQKFRVRTKSWKDTTGTGTVKSPNLDRFLFHRGPLGE
jgi:hypothetical protein